MITNASHSPDGNASVQLFTEPRITLLKIPGSPRILARASVKVAGALYINHLLVVKRPDGGLDLQMPQAQPLGAEYLLDTYFPANLATRNQLKDLVLAAYHFETAPALAA